MGFPPRPLAEFAVLGQQLVATANNQVSMPGVERQDLSDQDRAYTLGAILAMAVLGFACVVLYWNSWSEVGAFQPSWVDYWPGRVIIAISAWLIWLQRHILAAGALSWAGIVAIVAVSFIWLLASAADVLNVQVFLLPLLLLASVLAYFGPAAARALAFPIAYLYLALPVVMLIQAPLHAITTVVAGLLAQASGIPVLLEGNFVTIPAGRFEIADGCAGHGYFIYAATIAALYGYLRLDSWPRRFVLMMVALGLAMVMNWIRVFSVIMIGHISDMQHYVVRVEHDSLGWILFAVAMVILFLVGGKLEHGQHSVVDSRKNELANAPPIRVASLLATIAALAAAPLLWALAESGANNPESPVALAVPAAPEGWRLETGSGRVWRPAYIGADAEAAGRYVSHGGSVDVWLMLYVSQEQGKELVQGGNRIADTATWSIENISRMSFDPPMKEAELESNSGDRRIVRWWYEVGGWNTNSALGAKLRQVGGRLTGRNEAGLIAMSTPCEPDCAAARDRLGAFSMAAAGELRGAIYGFRYPEEK